VVVANSFVGQDVDGAARRGGEGHCEGGEQAPYLGRVWALSASSGEVLWHSGGLVAGEVKGSPAVLHVDLDQDLQCSPSKDQQPPLPLAVVCVGSHDGRVYVCF
jgi:hypothetical protein